MKCIVCGATPPATIHREALQRAWVTNHTKRAHTPTVSTITLQGQQDITQETAKILAQSTLCARCGLPQASGNLNGFGYCPACESVTEPA